MGLLLVLCVSAFQEAGSSWDRPLGAVGLALGCALLFALLVGHRGAHARSTPQAMPDAVAVGNGTLLLATGHVALSHERASDEYECKCGNATDEAPRSRANAPVLTGHVPCAQFIDTSLVVAVPVQL